MKTESWSLDRQQRSHWGLLIRTVSMKWWGPKPNWNEFKREHEGQSGVSKYVHLFPIGGCGKGVCLDQRFSSKSMTGTCISKCLTVPQLHYGLESQLWTIKQCYPQKDKVFLFNSSLAL